MKTGNIYISFIIIIFCSCTVKQTDLFMNTSYMINLDGKQELSLPFSNYFKSAEIIILETNADCLIGRIEEFQVFDECIYILDAHIANSLFVFDIEGRFIRKIGRVGRGPGEYIKLLDFTLDTENRFIYLLDFGQRIHKYSLDGAYIQTIIPQIDKTNVIFIQYFSGKLYMSVRAWTPTPDDYMLLETDTVDGKILSSSLPLKYNKGWAKPFDTGHSFFMSRLSSPPLYAQLFMDYIVTIGEKIFPYIELKSKHLVTDTDLENFLEDNDYVGKFMNAFQEKSKIWDMHDFVENDNFIMFRYRTKFRILNTVIYHKKTETVKLINYLHNDLIFKSDTDGIYRRFVFSDKGGAYEVLQSVRLDNFLKSARNNELVNDLDKFNDLLKLSQLKEEPNPIIIYYEFI